MTVEARRRILGGSLPRIFKQLAIFGAVSVATTVLDFMIFNLLIGWRLLPVVAANTISYGVGIAASYVLNKHLTFGARSRPTQRNEVGIFVVVNVAGLGLNNGAVAIAQSMWGTSTLALNLAKLVAGVVTWVGKFAAFRRWVYPDSSSRPAGAGVGTE